MCPANGRFALVSLVSSEATGFSTCVINPECHTKCNELQCMTVKLAVVPEAVKLLDHIPMSPIALRM